MTKLTNAQETAMAAMADGPLRVSRTAGIGGSAWHAEHGTILNRTLAALVGKGLVVATHGATRIERAYSGTRTYLVTDVTYKLS